MSKFKFLFISLALGLFLTACSQNAGGTEAPDNVQDPIVNPDPHGGQGNPNDNPNDNPDPNGGQDNPIVDPPAVEYTYNFWVRLDFGQVKHINPKFSTAEITWGEIKALFLELGYPQYSQWEFYEVIPGENKVIYGLRYDDTLFSSSKEYYFEERK